MTTLPRDSNHDVIQALRLKEGGAHKLAATSLALVRNVTPFNAKTRVVSVFSTQPIYIAFGDGTVTVDNTGHYFPANIYYDLSVSGADDFYDHIAILAVDADASVYISEKH